MRITGVVWLESIVNKLEEKHRVTPEEVEELFSSRPRFRHIQRGKVAGEDLYSAMGQTDNGRYLVVFFVYKHNQNAIVISARDMSAKERKLYGKE